MKHLNPSDSIAFTGPQVNIDDTHLVGHVNAPFSRLVEIFGEPEDPDNDRCAFRWRLQFADGTVATVYDWKASSRFDDRLPNPEALRSTNFREWNVGGNTERAVRLVNQAVTGRQLR